MSTSAGPKPKCRCGPRSHPQHCAVRQCFVGIRFTIPLKQNTAPFRSAQCQCGIRPHFIFHSIDQYLARISASFKPIRDREGRSSPLSVPGSGKFRVPGFDQSADSRRTWCCHIRRQSLRERSGIRFCHSFQTPCVAILLKGRTALVSKTSTLLLRILFFAYGEFFWLIAFVLLPCVHLDASISLQWMRSFKRVHCAVV